MDSNELATLVRAMRASQRRYFRHRTHDDLEESKRLEREVDRAVEAVLSAPVQASLFSDEGDI